MAAIIVQASSMSNELNMDRLISRQAGTLSEMPEVDRLVPYEESEASGQRNTAPRQRWETRIRLALTNEVSLSLDRWQTLYAKGTALDLYTSQADAPFIIQVRIECSLSCSRPNTHYCEY
jgi:hypothetical protein